MIRSAAAMVALMVCGVTTAATINVPADYASIQDAIDAASSGDEIVVSPGIYSGAASTEDEVVHLLWKRLTLRSSGGASQTIIDGGGSVRGITCVYDENGGSVIDGFTIRNGRSLEGGGVRVSISDAAARVTIRNCIISNNVADSYQARGGGISCGSNVTVDNCTITGNTALSQGGGVYLVGNPTVINTTIAFNQVVATTGAYDGGGGVFVVAESEVVLENCVISHNESNRHGGGAFSMSLGNARFANCTIADNSASIAGGGLLWYRGDITLTDCDVVGNSAAEQSFFGGGGGLALTGSQGSAEIVDCEIQGNSGYVGGGIRMSNGSVSISTSNVCGNTSTWNEDQTYGTWNDGGGNCIEADCDCCSYDCEFELPDEPAGQDEEPEYEDYGSDPGKTKLVVITHGINTPEEDFEDSNGWAMQMKAAIEAQVADDPTWEVRTRWTVETATPWSVEFAILGSGDGSSIAQGDYEHVHLIGHSAGAWYLDACAKRIREEPGNQTTIHCTYLDPACVVPIIQQQYRGMSADYAENYFSREAPWLWCGLGAWATGAVTQTVYSQCFNIDVSRLDPDYDDSWLGCLSSHQWPHCFYRLSADADVSSDADCDVINGEYTPYGFGLARENFNSELSWLGVVSQFPRGNDPPLELPEGPGFHGGSSGDEDYIVFEHFDDPLNLYHSMNYELVGFVDIDWPEDSVTLSASGVVGTSWLNLELIPTKPTNIVKLRLAPGAVGAAVGMTTVLLDGEQIGVVDERHMPSEGDMYVFGMQRIAPPGEPLILSIRLDTFGDDDASMTASSIQIGHSDIRWHCLSDLTSVGGGQGDLDGKVDHADLAVILGEWSTFCAADCAQSACPGDIDFDCRVGVLDLLELLMSWGECE